MTLLKYAISGPIWAQKRETIKFWSIGLIFVCDYGQTMDNFQKRPNFGILYFVSYYCKKDHFLQIVESNTSPTSL